MRRTLIWRLLNSMFFAVVVCALFSQHGMAEDAKEQAVRLFRETVAPALAAKCVSCHRADNLKGQFDITTAQNLLKGGESGVALVPGQPLASSLYLRTIPHEGEKPEMPEKGDALTELEAQSLRQWISLGAPWPEGFVLKEKSKADASFWSFQPLAEVVPPEVTTGPEAWRTHPIDRFLMPEMQAKGLSPNPPAMPYEFIRRITFDLTGLPPTPEEIEQFVQACPDGLNDAAIEQLIDRLLASPRYGEQWGRHWLDVIRFGESRGYERNEIITNLWPFRDYIIRSFNEDKPFDRLIHEHLAGDVIGKDQPEIEVGSAFLVAGPYDDVGNQDAVAAAQIRADQMDEMIRATGEAFLGLSIGCARCHDHKFDPILARDYYAFYATFAGTVHGPREVATPEARQARAAALEPLQKLRQPKQNEKAEIEKRLAELKKTPPESTSENSAEDSTAKLQDRLSVLKREIAELDGQIANIPALPVWWVGNHRSAPGPFHVFVGGNPQQRSEIVLPSGLDVFNTLPSKYEVADLAHEATRRVALAKWLTAPDQPLVPRVLANRIWQYHFGSGMVDTPSDFGYLGGRPTHPALLDWLAGELLRSGWKLKPIHKLILTSQAYRQSSDWRDDQGKRDAASRLLWRFPPRRLSAEEIRDSMLNAAGVLNLSMGGPGFRLYEYQQDNVATYVPKDVHGPETYRRAVYHHTARASRVDVLTDFDCPDPALAEPRRASTTTPLQALTMMNHQFSIDMATKFAGRLGQVNSDTSARIQVAYLLTYGRSPTDREISQAAKVIQQVGLRGFCHALLNSNEFIFIR